MILFLTKRRFSSIRMATPVFPNSFFKPQTDEAWKFIVTKENATLLTTTAEKNREKLLFHRKDLIDSLKRSSDIADKSFKEHFNNIFDPLLFITGKNISKDKIAKLFLLATTKSELQRALNLHTINRINASVPQIDYSDVILLSVVRVIPDDVDFLLDLLADRDMLGLIPSAEFLIFLINRVAKGKSPLEHILTLYRMLDDFGYGEECSKFSMIQLILDIFADREKYFSFPITDDVEVEAPNLDVDFDKNTEIYNAVINYACSLGMSVDDKHRLNAAFLLIKAKKFQKATDILSLVKRTEENSPFFDWMDKMKIVSPSISSN